MSAIPAFAAAALLAAPAGWAAARIAQLFGAQRPGFAILAPACLGLFVWAVAMESGWTGLAATLVLAWTLLVLATVDLASLRLPDALTLPLIAAGLAISLPPDLVVPGELWLDHLIGAAAGFTVLAAIGWAFWRWREREGLGLGDAKLLGAGGAWLGWRPLPLVVLLACAVAFGWIGLRLIFRGRTSLREPIAFGVPLAAAIWLAWLYSA